MAESIKLLKTIEQFISNKCLQKKEKNTSFEINYHSNGPNNLPILYDNTHNIPCLITNKKEMEELNKINNDSHLLIKDSKLELIFYKSDSESKFIKCCIIFIVNEFSIIKNLKEEENILITFDKENNIDINYDDKIVKRLKKFLYDFIKKNKTKSLTKIFLEPC